MTAGAAMLDHATAERLAAASIDGFLVPKEAATLDEHLRACSTCRSRLTGFEADARSLRHLDLGDAPATTRARVSIDAEKALERRGGLGLGRGMALVAAAALLLMALGASVLGGVGGRGGTAEEPGPPPIVIQTDVVQLSADEFWIDADGLRFKGATPVSVHSDSSETHRTFELAWLENGREMRMNFYFESDGGTWWVREIRTYDGRQPGEWVTALGRFFPSPMGVPWTGDVDLQLTQPELGTSATLHIGDMTLSTTPIVAAPPGADDPVLVPVPAGAGPDDPGGLRCTGILQMGAFEAEQALLALGFDKFTWILDTDPAVPVDSLKGIEDPVIVNPGTVELRDGTFGIFVLPASDPNAERVPFPDDCPPPPNSTVEAVPAPS